MCLLVFLFAPIYLSVFWILTHFLFRDARRRRAVRMAAIISLALTAAVALLGVPYTYKSTRMPAFYAAIGILLLGPVFLPRLDRRGRWAVAGVLSLLFGLPVLRVEYLTLRHGGELREAYEVKAGPGSSDEALLFSVFDYSSEGARVLRVEGKAGSTMGYFLRFRRQGEWDVNTDPQAVLWSDAGSAFVACPYPAAVVLLLRGVGSVKC